MRRYICLPQSTISYGKFSLETIQDVHLEPIRNWRNEQMEVLRQKEKITPQQQKEYFEKHIWSSLDSSQPTNILLSFLENGNLIGYGGLVHISWENKRAEISFLLDTVYIADIELYNRYFSAFLFLIKKLAFEQLWFNKLFTETFSFRKEHIKILEQNNLELEGCLRQHVIINNVPIDSLLHGCLKDKK